MAKTEDKKGVIFDVQRFCTHDGPGIRTTIFMKGCPLNCRWCHNPESIDGRPQIRYFEEKCIGCGRCEAACRHGLHSFTEAAHTLAFSACKACGKCADACPADALVLCGEEVDVDGVMAHILPDVDFYGDEGGVTFSGGEPLLQAEFLRAVLRVCKRSGIGTAVDTSGCAAWTAFERVMDYVDVFLYDVKAWDEDTHKCATGVSNKLILANLEKLDRAGKRIWIRMPVVDKVNNDDETMARIAEFVSRLENVEYVTLMPFHKTGKKKCETIGAQFFVESDAEIPDGEVARFQRAFEQRGMTLR